MAARTLLAPGSRLVLVLPSLGPGGTERVVTGMANWWAGLGHHVTVVTLDGPEAGEAFPLDARVRRVRLGVARPARSAADSIRSNVIRIGALRRVLRSTPGYVLSFIDVTNVLVLLAAVGLGRSVVVAERTDPAIAPLGTSWKIGRRFLYRRASLVVAQTTVVGRWIGAWLGRPIAVIPNPVSMAAQPAAPAARAHVILGVGRFTREKGFDLLLHAFARVADAFPEWRLRLAGDGPLRDEWRALAETLGIAARVEWLGVQRDTARLFAESAVFALPSRFEGFPNALCEAMAAGAAVVAFDCPSGPREIVTDDQDGRLVPAEDVSAMANTLRELLASADKRQRLGERARDIAQRLAPQTVMPLWERALLSSSGEDHWLHDACSAGRPNSPDD
jgi:glycosyltransferase involved in cell wall biosynthesis